MRERGQGVRVLPMKMRISVIAALILAALLAAGQAYGGTVPVLVFDARFDLPLSRISSFGPGSKLLGVQLTPDGSAPTRVISVDKRGRVNTVDEVSEVKEISVPASRLWISGEGEKPEFGQEATGEATKLPVVDTRVFLAGGGGAYTVVYRTKGAYYEVRHKDADGRLLFIAAPMDGYGFKTLRVSDDGSRVLVVDESPMTGGVGGKVGQRLYFYDRDGRLLADHNFGDNLDAWLNASEGAMAADGSTFVSVRGRGEDPGTSVVAFDGRGRVKWEKRYYTTHRLSEDFGGTYVLKGGSKSLISLIDAEGELKTVERAGYGFDLWLSEGRSIAYLIVFKPFDVAKSGLEQEVKASYPQTKVVALDLHGLVPKGCARPGVTIARDGRAFVHYCNEDRGGQPVTSLGYYDATMKELWREEFFGSGVLPQFVDGSRGFMLKFGYPVTRLVYYESPAQLPGKTPVKTPGKKPNKKP